MQFKSLSHLREEAVVSFNRFPLTVLISILGTLAGLVLSEDPDGTFEKILVRILLATLLGGALSFSAHLLVERRSAMKPASSLIVLFLSCVLPFLYAFFLCNVENPPESEVLRHFVLMAGVHFLVAFAPFGSGTEINGFWQFNKSLFLRFMLSVLYAFVIFVGISVALVAITSLFPIKLDEILYLQIWIVTVGLVQTWFFLSGVPRKLESLEADRNYPLSLRVFAQYVLLPLSAVYMAILYAYGFKILVTMDWPKGWVGWLVSVFSAAGILTLLFLHPYQELVESRWIKRATTLFYALTLPLTGLLLGSVYLRISEYGITESRYYLLVLAFWLAGLSLYFLLSRMRDIRVIPMTLAFLALVSSFGPWSASRVTFKSQIGRLQDFLLASETSRNNDEISAVLDYLQQSQNFQEASVVFAKDLGDSQQTAAMALQVKYLASSERVSAGSTSGLSNFYFYAPQGVGYELPGFGTFKNFSLYANDNAVSVLDVGVDVRVDWKANQLIVYENSKELARLELSKFVAFAKTEESKKSPSDSQNNILSVEVSGRWISLLVTALNGSTNQNHETTIDSLTGVVLVSGVR